MGGGLFFRHAPELAHLEVQKLGVEILVQHHHAFRHVVERAAQHFQFVGMADDVGDVGVAQHSAAVRQARALHADHVAVGPAQIERPGIARPHQANPLGDIGVDFGSRDLIGLGVAAMIHQRHEGRIAVGDRVRQRPHAPEGAVDELAFHVGVEQQYADVHDVERRTQRQHLSAHDVVAAPRLVGAVSGGFFPGHLLGLEDEAYLLVGLPRALAGLRFALARDQQMEMLGNAEHTFHLDDGADIGDPAYDAIDRGLAVVGDHLAGQERAASRC